MAGEYQKELFEEFKEKKGKFKKIADKITQRQKKLYLHLPLENIVFAIIIVIMCIIVAFALGVERGKRISLIRKEELFKGEITLPEIEIKVAKPSKATTDTETAQVEEKIQEVRRPYTVQLISYREMPLAEKEKKKLLAKKIDAFIIPSGNWYQVCAGKYKDMKEAKLAQKKFLKDYEGCFIRKGVK